MRIKKKGRWQEAHEAYKTLVGICPGLISSHLGFAEAALHTKNIQDAAGAISVVLAKEPNNVEALWIQTRVKYHSADNANETLDCIKCVLKIDSSHSGALDLKKKIEKLIQLRQKGNDAFKAKNYSESIKIYTDALTEEDKKLTTAFTAVIFANRAAAYKQLNDFDNAIVDYSSAIGRNSTYVKAYIRRAQCYQEIDLWDDAIKDYSTAISFEPFNTEYVDLINNAQRHLQEQKTRSYYDVMGLPAFASAAEIKKAYRMQALKYHPDKVANSGISSLKAEKMFKEIQFCYENLSDPQKKAQYDRELQIQKSMQHNRVFSSAPQNFPFAQQSANNNAYASAPQNNSYSHHTNPYQPQAQQQNGYTNTGW